MKPGVDLDAAVSKVVMGTSNFCQRAYHGIGGGLWSCGCGVVGSWEDPSFDHFPPYSTQMAAAWLLVEKIRGEALDVFSLMSPTDESKNWFAGFERKWHGRSFTNVYGREAGETAAHAICLAALKAAGPLT